MGFDALFAELLAGQRALRADLARVLERLDAVEGRMPAGLVSVDEAAVALRMCRTTVQRQARDGRLPATRRGRKWLIDLAKVRPVDADQVRAAAADARDGK